MSQQVTVNTFLEHARERLELELMMGEEFLERPIKQEAINRPGLALTGFFQYFAHERIQVMGLAEMTYLKSLSEKDRRERLGGMFERHIPCAVLTRSRNATPELQEMARRHKTPLFRSRMITNRFINEATLLMEELSAEAFKMQGTTMDVLGVGVLIEGAPGIGKSEAALGLVERGHSLVADDISILRRDNRGGLVCDSSEVTRYHMEIRGLGIIHVPSLFGMASVTRDKCLDLIIELLPACPENEGDRSGLKPGFRTILDVKVPVVTLPVAAGRDVANVIEVACMNQKLKNLGHDAAKELDEKIISRLTSRSR